MFRQAKPPIPVPASEKLPVMERNGIVVPMVVMEMTSQFLQIHGSGKAAGKSNDPKWMRPAIVHRLTIF